MTSTELRTATTVVILASILLALGIGGAWGHDLLTTREAHGALAGLLVADTVLASSALAYRLTRGVAA